MNKTKKTFYNTLATSAQMLVMQIISLVVSRKVLEVYGSDLNGVNAILSNVMDWILLLEGGLTLASNVALFKPFVNKDYDRCNHILSATKKKFQKIGILVLVCGIAMAVFYPLVIKTNILYIDILLMFSMMSLSTSFSVFYTRKYALLYNVSQSEYINTLVTTIVSVIGNAVIYVIAISGLDYLWIRLVYLLVTIATGLVLAFIAKRRYPFIDYSVEPDNEAIKGTKDVVFQKLTGLLRNSAPMIFISILVSSAYASVYSVYIFVYGFVRKLVLMVITATQSGIGQLIAEKEADDVYKVYRVFEFTSTFAVCWLMSVAIPMTMPFIRFYTKNVSDINYIDGLLLFFIAGDIFIQVMHVPSGTVMNMSGAFKKNKNYQIISIAIMVAAIFILSLLSGIYGLLAGIMIGDLVLAVLEVNYARKSFFKKSYWEFFRPIIVNVLICAPLMYLEMRLLPSVFAVHSFIISGVILAVVNMCGLLLANLIFERERLFSLKNRILSIFAKAR